MRWRIGFAWNRFPPELGQVAAFVLDTNAMTIYLRNATDVVALAQSRRHRTLGCASVALERAKFDRLPSRKARRESRRLPWRSAAWVVLRI
jgi:hypothetical protein